MTCAACGFENPAGVKFCGLTCPRCVLQLAGNPGFNAWQRSVWRMNHEKGRPVVVVTVGKLKPSRSRVVAPRLRVIAAA